MEGRMKSDAKEGNEEWLKELKEEKSHRLTDTNGPVMVCVFPDPV